ncbi:MAG: hypothetical protein LBR34_05360 [Prevotella sp.]|jgi:hypothetical protein|nr:hypothetical protein [Prevotella sp.]
MADNKKVYSIEINGVEQAVENVSLLKDNLSALDKMLANTQFSESLSGIFGSMETFSETLRNLNANMEILSEAAAKAETLSVALQLLQNDMAQQAASERAWSKTRISSWNELLASYETITGAAGQLQSCMGETFSALAALYDGNAESYRLAADSLKASIGEVDEKLAESANRRKSLLDEAKTASGGYSQAIQEQLAREMETNQELSRQKAELAKEEERLRKEAEASEKKAKRLEIVNGAVAATADVAMGVSKALSMGLLGIPIAAVIAAQGAIQIALIKKQLDKISMEDGGLLQGKRHAQGGMRIEGTNIEVEGDEYVVNRISTRKNLGLIDYINRSRRTLSPSDIDAYYARSVGQPVFRAPLNTMYENGGQLTNLNVVGGLASSGAEDRLLEAINRINFNPVVSVVDIMNVQQSMTQVKELAGA